MYVPLWNKTNYSFLEGASHPEELVDAAAALGLGALAITDRNGLYGVVRAHVRARSLGLRLLTGAQLNVAHSAATLLVLAQNRQGYAALCQLLSAGHLAARKKGAASFTPEQLQQAGQHVVWLCDDPALLQILQARFAGNVYGLFARHLLPTQKTHHLALHSACQRLGVPQVAANEVLYHSRSRQPLQDVVTCIRHGVTLEQAGTKLRCNAEHALRSAQAMGHLFADVPQWLRNSELLAQRCSFDLSQLRYRYPCGKNPQNSLRQLTFEGAVRRYGDCIPAAVQAQIDRELQLIAELDYGGYFLTMHAIVKFCRREKILCQGRGSAANSVVCYCLDITAIDPIQMDLLFERFISRERAEPPDIDLDIEHNRREEVIQWVYQHYGRRFAAMVANVVRFRLRSAIRQVGKVLGVATPALEALAKLSSSRDAFLQPAALQDAGLCESSPLTQHFIAQAQALLDFPRHLSVHPGGFLLGHEPVDTLVPIENATMEQRTVIQWDKQDIEDLGLFKVDLLGLGALTQIRLCFDLLQQHENLQLTMKNIVSDDAPTFAMICRADTVGVFQIESRAQMSMLPRLQPKVFYDLVVEVAIVRPGPIQGDMVHPYLRRRQSQEAVFYPHESFEKILKKTYGVPIFQEQVMKIAIHTAGYTPGEADQLRRDMAAWRSAGRIEQHHDKLVQRMVEKGVDEVFAERIFAQIRGFGEYGFPESHAASFAFIAYITAYLKCHHPAAFTCALLNAQPMGFYSPATVVQDALRHKVKVLPIDINHSDWDCTLQRRGSAWDIRMGLRYIRGFGTQERSALQQAAQAGVRPYTDVAHLVQHTGLSQKSLLALAEAGALSSLQVLRRDAIWAVRGLSASRHDSLALPLKSQVQKFVPLRRTEAIVWDHRTSFHSTHGHPMQALRGELMKQRMPHAMQLSTLPDGHRVHYVGMVICRQRPQTASGVAFFTLEDETGMVNLVLWKQVFEQFETVAKTCTLLGVSGHVQRDTQTAAATVHVIAKTLWLYSQ
jgi:error-prone DNA polymerase